MKLKNFIEKTVISLITITAVLLSMVSYASADGVDVLKKYHGVYDDRANTTSGSYYSFININRNAGTVNIHNMYYRKTASEEDGKNVTALCYTASITDSIFAATSSRYWYCNSSGTRTTSIVYGTLGFQGDVYEDSVYIRITTYLDDNKTKGHTYDKTA